MQFDLPLEQLQTYVAPDVAPADFDSFWAQTLAEVRRWPLQATFSPVSAMSTSGLAVASVAALRRVEVQDVRFGGYGGSAVRGWMLRPAGAAGPLPCLVEYVGYGGGRGFPSDWLLWPSAGYATLVMDTRGQGTTWRRGDTPDPDAGGEPHLPGFMTQGIAGRDTYYYRRLYADAVRAVEAARSHPGVDAERVAVTGGSQGGGLALAAAGLSPGVALCLPDVPFLSHFRRALTLTDSAPYSEIAAYLRTHRDQEAQVQRTLSYFDGLFFAERARARALFSVGLMDAVCPPSTVYAAYNRYGGPKDIRVYPYNGHEGGEAFQVQEKLAFVAQHLPLD